MPPHTTLVQVPATSANLGPGFDTLGLALDWTARIRVTIVDEIKSRPETTMESMIINAVLELYRRTGFELPPSIQASYEGDIPIGRGLGLSAVARVGGLLAANALTHGSTSQETLLRIAAQLEGHADNSTPAMLGGIQVVVSHNDQLHQLGIDPPDDLKLVLLIPEFSMPTNESRKTLPASVTRREAVHNIGRATMLVTAIKEHRYDLLQIATEDMLHQPSRSQLFPALFPIFQAAREAGALGTYLSGGGSTIAAFATDRFDNISKAMLHTAESHGYKAQTRICGLSINGAELLPDP